MVVYKFHHAAVSVRDLEKSIQFYGALGYEQVFRYDSDDGTKSIANLQLGDSFLELFYYSKNADKPPVDFAYANNVDEIGVKHIALRVNDINEALVDLKQKGLTDGNVEIKNGDTGATFFFIQDPDGIWVEFIEEKIVK